MTWENLWHARQSNFRRIKWRRIPSATGRKRRARILDDIYAARFQTLSEKMSERSGSMTTKMGAVVDDDIERTTGQCDCLIEKRGIVLRALHEMKTLVGRK